MSDAQATNNHSRYYSTTTAAATDKAAADRSCPTQPPQQQRPTKPPPTGPAPPAPGVTPPNPPQATPNGTAQKAVNGTHANHNHPQKGKKKAETPVDPQAMYESLKSKIAALEEELIHADEEEERFGARFSFLVSPFGT